MRVVGGGLSRRVVGSGWGVLRVVGVVLIGASAVIWVSRWHPVSSQLLHRCYPRVFAGEDETGGGEHGAGEKSK